VTTNWTTELALNAGDILNVIDVSMREEQEFWLDAKRAHPFASTLRSVEENPSFWRLQQVAVCFKNAAAKDLVNHCGSLYRGVATTEGQSSYEY
jgi:hypothetical protein